MRTWFLVIIAVSQMLAGITPTFASAAGEGSSAHCESGVMDSNDAVNGHMAEHDDEGSCSTDCQMCAACGITLHSQAVSQNFDAAGFFRPVPDQEPHAQPIKLLFRPPI